MSLSNKVTVVGGGLVGSLAALRMAKKGFQVTLYEKLPDIRQEQKGGGRSINLALSNRGIKALTEAGIIDDVMKLANNLPFSLTEISSFKTKLAELYK